MAMVFLEIDLANNVFAPLGVDNQGKAVLVRPVVRRDQLTEAVTKLPPSTIGMEACSGAHHWARQFERFGSHFPSMRHVPVKSELAPSRLVFFAVRQGWFKEYKLIIT